MPCAICYGNELFPYGDEKNGFRFVKCGDCGYVMVVDTDDEAMVKEAIDLAKEKADIALDRLLTQLKLDPLIRRGEESPCDVSPQPLS